MREIEKDFAAGPVQLFIDARAVKGASIDVSNDWALWLRANRARFAELGEVMRIYSDASAFDAALHASAR